MVITVLDDVAGGADAGGTGRAGVSRALGKDCRGFTGTAEPVPRALTGISLLERSLISGAVLGAASCFLSAVLDSPRAERLSAPGSRPGRMGELPAIRFCVPEGDPDSDPVVSWKIMRTDRLPERTL